MTKGELMHAIRRIRAQMNALAVDDPVRKYCQRNIDYLNNELRKLNQKKERDNEAI